MTVNTTNITSGPYVGNGLSDQYSYTFRVQDKTQLKVYETDDNDVQTLLIVDTDYTVAGIGDAAGGIITRVAGNLPTDYEWYIRSNYIENQLTAFRSQGAFFPGVHEDQMDHITFLIQQILDTHTRSMRLSDSIDIDGDFTIDDDAAARADNFLGFDNNGNLVIAAGLANVLVSAFMTPVVGFDNAFDVTKTLKTGYVVANKAELVALTLTSVDVNHKIFVTSDDGGHFIVRYNATPGTYTDSSVLYCGSIAIPTGGDGTIGIERFDLSRISVKHYGANGGGIVNDTVSITEADVYAASISNQPVVYFPPGDYLITPIAKTAKWVSDNVNLGTSLVWGGTDDGGIAIDCTGESGSFGGFRNIKFDSVSNQPTSWLDLPAIIDKFYEMQNVHFTESRGNAIIMYSWINCHWYDVRWDNIKGYIIQATPITSQNLSSFVISGFTYDHNIASSTCEGMIRIDNSVGNASNLGHFVLERGRIEVNAAWAGKQAIVVYKQAASPSSSRSLQVKLTDVTYYDGAGMANDCVLYRDTTNTTAQDSLILDNFSAESMSTILGGTWPTTQNLPVVQANAMNMIINAGAIVVINYSTILRNPSGSGVVIKAGVGAETEDRFTVAANGTLEWGNGSAVKDVSVSRYGPGNLRNTTGKFLADNGLGAGNSAANINTPAGATAYDLGIYDETGVLLGYIPIYAARW